MGRTAGGVTGIDLQEGDECIGLMVVSGDVTVLTIAENGMGKRSAFEDYRLTRRGAKGVINMKLGEKTGKVVACMTVDEKDEVMIITESGMVVRIAVNGCRVIGRATQGVRVISLSNDDKVATVACVAESDKEEDGGPELDQSIPDGALDDLLERAEEQAEEDANSEE